MFLFVSAMAVTFSIDDFLIGIGSISIDHEVSLASKNARFTLSELDVFDAT